jgi:hypothetical protein
MSLFDSFANRAWDLAECSVRARKDFRAKNALRQRCARVSTSQPFAVVGNAIPKSGTYLLNSIFREIGLWGNPNIHLLDSQTFLMNRDEDTRVLRLNEVDAVSALPDGVFVAAHLHYSDALSSQFGSGRFKHIFQYRDFRDVFLSYAAFFAFNDNSGHFSIPRKEQAFFREFFEDHNDRISYAICKNMEQCRFEDYAGWLKDPNTLVFKFENLHDELASGTKNGFGANMLRLFGFLGLDPSGIDAEKFVAGVLGGSLTKSNGPTKTMRFREEFQPQHYRLLENDRFRRLVELFDLAE